MSLTKEQRDALPDTDFGVPGKRALPIHDERHVRMAWSQLPRTQGLSDSERSEAKTRILHKAKDLGVDVSDWEVHALAFTLDAMSLAVPEVEDHPNRMPFSGILTRIDEPSDAPPHGSGEKRTFIPKAVAEKAIPSLLGMAVDYTKDFDGHDKKAKIGVITEAKIVGNAIEIAGFLYASDFPEECARIRAEKNRLGFSYECQVAVSDMNADPWVITRCVFTGAAVLYKELAAYRTTSLAAKAEQEFEMTKEEMLAILAEANKPFAESLAALTEKVTKIEATGASLGGPIIDQVKPHVEACMACADAMEAAGVGSHPTMGHAAALRKIGRHMAVEAATGKVPHIYNDHSYFDASPSAAADASKKTDEAIAAAIEKAVAPLKAELEAANTKIVDLKAAAFNGAKPAERATLPANVQTLLAKAGIGDADVKDGKLSTAQVNAILDAGNIHGQKATELKLKLRHAGQMEVGTR